MISYFKNYASKTDRSFKFTDYLFDVKDGKWQDDVLKYRADKNPDVKKKLPAVTVSGVFKDVRNAKNIETHSGYLAIDIDAKENENVLAKRDELYSDPFIFAGHISVGGEGLVLYLKINKKKHLESFLGAEKYFADKYQIIIDQSCKDVSRLRFVSYDPELYINKNPKTWEIFIDKQNLQPPKFHVFHTSSDIDELIQQVRAKALDLTAEYSDWIKIGFAIASKYGEGGRSYFQALSQMNPKYNTQEVDRKYDNILRSNSDKTTISTLFWIAKQNGLKIVTKKTDEIVKLTKVRRLNVGTNGGLKSIEDARISTIDTLKYQGIECTPDDLKLIDEVLYCSDDDLNSVTEENSFEKLIYYLKTFDLKYNEVTKRVEFNGEPISDLNVNSIFVNAKLLFEKDRINKELINTIIESDRIPTYHPFRQFFERHPAVNSTKCIDELFSCFQCHATNLTPYYGIFITKWLLSIIASMHGTYSLLIMVLIGEQSTGKTKFFRDLLPEDLSSYFTESKLDKGTDDEILMTQKLIVCDDEFGGKTKKEYTRLKELSSKQQVTARKSYGRHSETANRYAVLCGTSNEMDIINDPTGNRRILPVYIDSINFDRFAKIDKTMLFQELYFQYKENPELFMLTKEEIDILNKQGEDFVEISLEEEMISKCFKASNTEMSEFLTTTEILTYLEAKLEKQRLSLRKVGLVLRKLGFKRIKRGIYGYSVDKIG